MTEAVTSLALSVQLKKAGAPQIIGTEQQNEEDVWLWWDFHQGDPLSGPPRWVCKRSDDFNYCDWDPPVAGRAFTAGELWALLKKHGSIEVSESTSDRKKSVVSVAPEVDPEEAGRPPVPAGRKSLNVIN